MYALSKLKCTFECENDISTIGAASGEEYTYISEANGSLSVLLFFVCVCVCAYLCTFASLFGMHKSCRMSIIQCAFGTVR
jgi:hypothetical protein